MLKKVVRVVLASPSDVQAERDIMDTIVQDLNAVFRGIAVDAIMELWRWETDGRPGMHPSGAQGRLDDILQFGEKDILIGVFWRRLGTPTLGSPSATVHELNQAIGAWKKTGAPLIMLYFRDVADEGLLVSDPQYCALKDYRRELIDREQPLVCQYANPSDFQNRVRTHLHVEAMRLIDDFHAPPLQVTIDTQPTITRCEGVTELIGDLFAE